MPSELSAVLDSREVNGRIEPSDKEVAEFRYRPVDGILDLDFNDEEDEDEFEDDEEEEDEDYCPDCGGEFPFCSCYGAADDDGDFGDTGDDWEDDEDLDIDNPDDEDLM